MVRVGLEVRLGDGLDEGVIDGSGVGSDATETYIVSVGFDAIAVACELGSRLPQATLPKVRTRIAKYNLHNFNYHHLYLLLVFLGL